MSAVSSSRVVTLAGECVATGAVASCGDIVTSITYIWIHTFVYAQRTHLAGHFDTYLIQHLTNDSIFLCLIVTASKYRVQRVTHYIIAVTCHTITLHISLVP